MYRENEQVLKKSVVGGIAEGFVIRSWLNLATNEEYVRIRWNTMHRSTCKATSVVPNTTENIALLEDKYSKRREKWPVIAQATR